MSGAPASQELVRRRRRHPAEMLTPQFGVRSHTLPCESCDGGTQILLQETQSRWWVPTPNQNHPTRRCTLTSFVTKGSTQATKKPEPNPRPDFFPNTLNFPTDLSEALDLGLFLLDFLERTAGLLLCCFSRASNKIFRCARPK